MVILSPYLYLTETFCSLDFNEMMMKFFKNTKLKRKMKVYEKNIHSLINLLHWTIDFCSSAFLFVAFNKRAPVFVIITWFSQLSKKYFDYVWCYPYDLCQLICEIKQLNFWHKILTLKGMSFTTTWNFGSVYYRLCEIRNDYNRKTDSPFNYQNWMSWGH